MKTVSVVTGGGGFIGHHLVKELEKSENILVLDNFSRGVPERLNSCGSNVEVTKCDITNFNELKRILDKYKIKDFYHLAAINGTGNFYKIPVQIMDVGIHGCHNVLNYSLEKKVERFIIASSAEVYQDPPLIPTPENVPLIVPSVTNPRYSYALSKIYTEYYSYQFGIKHNKNISIFRPHNVFGPDMGLQHVVPQFIMEFLKSENKELAEINTKGSLDAIRAFCYVDDIVNGLKIIRNKNEGVNVFNIGNDEKVSMRDLLERIANLTTKKYSILSNHDEHAGGTKLRCPDISKIKSLGYCPQYSLDDGLSITVNWYKKNYNELSKYKNEKY